MHFETRPAARNVPARSALAVMLAVLAAAAALAFAGEGRADAAAVPSAVPTANQDLTGSSCTGPVLTRWVQAVLSSNPSSAIKSLQGRTVTIAQFRAMSGVTWHVQIREGRDCGGTLGYRDRQAWVPSASFPGQLDPTRPPSCDQFHRSRQPVSVADRRVVVTVQGGLRLWQRQVRWRVNVTDECGDTHQEDLGWTHCASLNNERLYRIHERAVRASDNRIAYRVTESFSVGCPDNRHSQRYSASYWTYSMPATY